MTIFIAGASRGVGFEVLRLLREQGLPVRALLRSETARATLEALGAEVVLADATEIAQVHTAFAGASIDAVVSTVGGKPADGGVRADYIGNRNLVEAARTAGVQRFLLVSSIGSGNSAVALPERVLSVLGPVLVEKAKAEQHLIESGLCYTVIRPGGLKSEPATGNGALTEDPRVSGTIHRADVAQLVCRALHSARSHHRIFSAVDRQMTESIEFDEFLLE